VAGRRPFEVSESKSSLGQTGHVTRLAIVGSTATGKTGLALAIAAEFAVRGEAAEIVSADSMCVYRGMDIGTAKPSTDEMARIPHHLVNVVDPTVAYSVADFQASAFRAIREIEERGNHVVLVGGTGLYVDAVVDELTMPGQFPEVKADLESQPDLAVLYARLVEADPLAATRMEPTNRRRIVRALEVCIGSGMPFSSFGPGLKQSQVKNRWTIVGLQWPREELARRIAARYAAQMHHGFLQEAEALLIAHGSRLSKTARQALGYREIWTHIESPETYSLEMALADAVLRTRQFSVRQERWFRRDLRIEWLAQSEESAGGSTSRVFKLLGSEAQQRFPLPVST
jgi:tRNA dimethylallyltransferase